MVDQRTVDRPDLEEFLSALSGFVDKKSTTPDSGYIKFLDIFCRSVGSAEGHWLRPGADGRLESLASFGVSPEFGPSYNASRDRGDSPLDRAFSTQSVVAIVEIKPGDVAPWFHVLMQRFGYQSLVAVPIIGPMGATGVLCAYYRDVCLFDQSTVERLSAVGRMLGGAEGTSEKPVPAAPLVAAPAPVVPAVGAGWEDMQTDAFAAVLIDRPFTKVQVFQHLVKAARGVFVEASMICGPVRVDDQDMVITVADSAGIPHSSTTQRFLIPQKIRQLLLIGGGLVSLPAEEQREMKSILRGPVEVLCHPVLWQRKIVAAVILWRPAGQAWGPSDERRLSRFTAIAALALNAA